MDGKRLNPNRSSGILLHLTSLPGRFGIGDLGPAAYAWIDHLNRAKQAWWQTLPLGPTGFGDSPYQCLSAFAGNPLLISPEMLLRDGLADAGDLEGQHFPVHEVDFERVSPFKSQLIAKAFQKYRGRPDLVHQFEEFCATHAYWLDDFTLFVALKDAHRGVFWQEWPRDIVLRQSEALDSARRELQQAIGVHKFAQFLFYRQWQELRRYARDQRVRFIGDMPIFVSIDSSDVWAHPEQFQLDEHRRPTHVAGVPPDYFSETGQLWGNPLYDWHTHENTGFDWWVSRLQSNLELVDLVRIDHFRGFESYWEIPAGSQTAQTGRWVQGPGARLFERMRERLGSLPLIAEDLGIITDAVYALVDEVGLPGMRVLQFAFNNNPEDRFLPHNYVRNTVVYTGTHDNDTTNAWYRALPEHDRQVIRRYVPQVDSDPAWELLRLAWSSIADYAIVPMQDVLSLGTEARMNFPGKPDGNWRWRYEEHMLTDYVIDRLGDATETFGRASH